MPMENKTWSIIKVLREGLVESEYDEILTLGGLLVYLSRDARYKEVVDMQKIVRAEASAREELLGTLKTIENDIPYFKGVFGGMGALKKLESTQITRIFYELNAIAPEKDVDEWLNEVLRRTVESIGWQGGESNTPDEINKLAISILSPIEGSFYDGVFGYGGGLLEAYRNGPILKIFGQEINLKIWTIAKIRLFIAGNEDNQLGQGDVLNQPAFTEGDKLKQFDFIYMDAPFSMRIQNYDGLSNDQYNRFYYGMPSRSNGDYAFISHMLASLKANGRGILVTTNGALFRGGAEGRIRTNIIASDLIEAVISLPAGLYDKTMIPVSLIVFNKNKKKSRKNKIQFIQASELFTRTTRTKRVVSDEAIIKITSAMQGEQEINGFSIFVANGELEDNNLNPSRYLLPTEAHIEGFGSVNFNMKAFEEIETTPLKSNAGFFRGFNVGSKNEESDDGEFRIVKLSDVQKGQLIMETVSRYHIENNAKTAMYELQENDVILSIRGSSLKVAVIPAGEENLLLSQNFIGIRCDKKLNPQFLKVYLESPLGQYLLTNKMSGTAIPTLSRKDIEALEIPKLSIKMQNEMMDQYNVKEQFVEEEIKRLKTELIEAKIETYTKMGIKDAFDM